MFAVFKLLPLVFTLLNGKKTYLAAAAGAVVIVANAVFPGSIPGVSLDPSDWLSQLLLAAGAATARHAVAKK